MLENIRPMPSLFSRFTTGERTPRKSGPQRPPPGSRFSIASGLEDEGDLDSNRTPSTKGDIKQEEEDFKIPVRPVVSEEERQVRPSCIKSSVIYRTKTFDKGHNRASKICYEGTLPRLRTRPRFTANFGFAASSPTIAFQENREGHR